MNENTTIAALATAPAPAGIAVIRISGPATKTALKALFKSKRNPIEKPRLLILGDLIDYNSSEVIDRALAVYMPAPFSFTGEDIAEFQFHGSPLIVQKILRSLFAFGITPAEPGEFTKRAFLNGKMDLVQAEAISDIINATSEQALKIASEQLHGRFSQTISKIGEPLRDILAEIEAGIDFPEEDINPEQLTSMKNGVAKAIAEIKSLLQTYSFGHKVKEGYRVLLCGAPNAGKSSLLNLLLGKERAIVTDISGTTRDLIEEEATIAGYKFVFCDSAGITETEDTVERIGIELAREKVGWADLVVLVADASDKKNDWEGVLKSIRGKAKNIWMVINKIDLNGSAIGTIFCDSSTCRQNFYVSVKTSAGIDTFIKALVEEVESSMPSSGESNSIITNERHRKCLEKALLSLEDSLNNIMNNLPAEIVSSDIRSALSALQEIVGVTHTEDILGRIFSKFCIGK